MCRIAPVVVDANRLIDLGLGIYDVIFLPHNLPHSSLSQLEILIVAVSEAKVKENTLTQSAWLFQKCDCGRTDIVCERALAPSIRPFSWSCRTCLALTNRKSLGLRNAVEIARLRTMFLRQFGRAVSFRPGT